METEGYVNVVVGDDFSNSPLCFNDVIEINYWENLITSNAVDDHLTGEDLVMEAIKNNWCFLQIN